MRLTEPITLPAPPPGKTSWPWIAQSSPWPATMPDGSAWPKISVITPSYNQGQFIEETIRSVLLQGYPNLEYIIIDGGSTDDTVQILEKYSPFLAYWVSERDNGQAHALNKGFSRATGEIFYWLNSDDYAGEGAFRQAVELFATNPGIQVLYGDYYFIKQDGEFVQQADTMDYSLEKLISTNFIGQLTVFFKGELWKQYGPVKENLNFIMDYELWLRWGLAGVKFKYFPEITAYYRLHDESKTINLMRVNHAETTALMYELKAAGKIPPYLQPKIGDLFYNLSVASYVRDDLPQFWKNFFQYIKYTKHPPDPPLLLKASTALFGMPGLKAVRMVKAQVVRLKKRAKI